MNRYGDRGSPCLMPECNLYFTYSLPRNMMLSVHMCIEAMQETNMTPAPNLINFQINSERDILSNAPSKSAAIMNNVCLDFFACCIKQRKRVT